MPLHRGCQAGITVHSLQMQSHWHRHTHVAAAVLLPPSQPHRRLAQAVKRVALMLPMLTQPHWHRPAHAGCSIAGADAASQLLPNSHHCAIDVIPPSLRRRR